MSSCPIPISDNEPKHIFSSNPGPQFIFDKFPRSSDHSKDPTEFGPVLSKFTFRQRQDILDLVRTQSEEAGKELMVCKITTQSRCYGGEVEIILQEAKDGCGEVILFTPCGKEMGRMKTYDDGCTVRKVTDTQSRVRQITNLRHTTLRTLADLRIQGERTEGIGYKAKEKILRYHEVFASGQLAVVELGKYLDSRSFQFLVTSQRKGLSES